MNAVPPVQHGTDADVESANAIYKDFLVRCRDSEFGELKPADKLSYYHRMSPEVVKKFPIVFRYMVETGQYNTKALQMYIDKLKKHPYKTEEEYCERSADYVKFLYMKSSARWNANEANQLWKDAKQALQEEMKEFKEKLDTLRKTNEDMNALNAYERKEELRKHIQHMQTQKIKPQ